MKVAGTICAMLIIMPVFAGGEEAAPAETLTREKAKLDAQRLSISAELAKAAEEARDEQRRQIAQQQEQADPPGLLIAAPPASKGSELYTIQADKVKLEDVLLCLARKGRFEIVFDSTVDAEVLEEAVTADLRLAPLEEALDALTGMGGAWYSTGRGADGTLQVLISGQRTADHAEAVEVLHNNAVDVYTRVLLKYPEEEAAVAASFHVAQIHFDEQQYALAAQEYGALLARDAHGTFSQPALLKLGRCYSKLGDYASASRALYDYLDRAPGPQQASEALLALATAARKAGETEEAIRACRRLLLEHPAAEKASDALYELADLLFEQGDYGGALRQYCLLRERHPEYEARMVGYRTALCKMRQGKWGVAARDFVKLLATGEQDDSAAGCYYGLAECLDKTGGALEALEAYLGAVERFPLSPGATEARVRIMGLYQSMGLLEKAITYGEESLRAVAPGSGAERLVEYHLAMALLEQGRCDRAMLLFEELAQSSGGEVRKAEALLRAGDAARKLGRFERAELLYRGALMAGPDSREKQQALLGLGDSYFARGEYDKAAVAYQGADPEGRSQ